MLLLPDHVQLLNVGREEAIKLVIKDDNAKDKDKDKEKYEDKGGRFHKPLSLKN